MDEVSNPARFVVLRHDTGSQLSRTDELHFDWMFEIGGALRTFASEPITPFERSDFASSVEVNCDRIQDHRLTYLDFEGEIGGNRGSVTRLLGGSYRLIDDRPDRFAVTLLWESSEALLTCYRILPDSDLRREESRALWRLRFSPGRNDTN